MIRHQLKQIFRSLKRHKSFTFINILGLTIGLASVLVLFLVAYYENSFDDFHSDSDNIYRVVSHVKRGTGIELSAAVPYPTGRFLRGEKPGIEVTQIHYSNQTQVSAEAREPAIEEKVVFADSLFFEVLNFAEIEDFWISGNQETALDHPRQVILTRSKAEEFFGEKNPVGQLLRIDNKVDVEVVGVVKDPPPNSHLPFSMIISFSTLNNDLLGGLDINSFQFISSGYTYVELSDQQDPAAVEAALQKIIKRNTQPGSVRKEKMFLQPLSEIHFDPAYEESNPSYTVSPQYLTMLLLLGGFILMIACVNYINLSTSFAFTKSKEVGIKKTIGASKEQLFFHYMLETFAVTIVATILAFALVVLILPQVNEILGKSLGLNLIITPLFLGGVFLLILCVSFISGIYPAIILSGFNPVQSLKNQLMLPGKSSTFFRKGLVVFQFATSIALIICTLVISRQMKYFQSKELGFNKEAVIEVRLPENDSLKREKFRNLILQEPGIEDITFGLGAPISGSGLGVGLKAAQLPENSEYTTKVIPSDAAYKDTYELKLVAGRWFLPSEEKNIGSAVVVNEELTKLLGFSDPEMAIGHTIELGLNNIRPQIVGVTENFHTSSLHDDISSVAMTPFPYFYYAAGIRISPDNMARTLSAIESVWRNVYPRSVYEMAFIDETLAADYRQEKKDFQLFRAFSFISIFICCIGLWGLISFVVVRKKKEIGIRKVLGASIGTIVLLLSRDFLKLIIIALLIASPVAWYFMKDWLQNFAYRIDIGWIVFVMAGLFALCIAFISISYQAVKAAMANPVRNLRTE